MAHNEKSARKQGLLARIGSVVGILSIQFVVFFVLLEIAGRIFDPLGISYYDETARLFDTMIIEEPIGYRFPPGLKGNFNGVPLEINEHGMRDRPVADQKEPGEFRILNLGDSVMFSVGVTYEDSIPAQLEKLANANAPEGRRYRTLNMGVPSYNTEQELEQLKQVGLGLKPDVATLYIIMNDLQEKMWVFDKRSNIIVDLAQRSYAAGLSFYAARWFVNLLGVSTNPSRPLMGGEEWQEPDSSLDDDEPGDANAEKVLDMDKVLANPNWRRIEDSLLEISAILKEADVPLLVFYNTTFRTSYSGRIIELGKQEGFAVTRLDVYADPRWQDLTITDYTNSPVDGHCNPAGCVLYATVIYEGLLEYGLLK